VRFPAAIRAPAVQHDLVPFDCEPFGSQPADAMDAAHQIVQAPAVPAEEEMVVLPRR
jgi:hypothetical protein